MDNILNDRIKGTKKELIQTFKMIRHNNYDLLFDNIADDRAFYFLNIKLYSLKYWNKLKIKALILNLTLYVKTLEA